MDDACPHLASTCGPGRLEVSASIDLGRLSVRYLEAPLELALSAVVEDTSGALSFWALAHAPGKPDFHHAAAFALTLPAFSETRHPAGPR